jgi:hypothetical protein
MSERTPDLEISYDLRQLAARHLETMEHVEVLVLLARDDAREWSVRELASELRWDDKLAQKCVEDLVAARLLSRTRSADRGPLYRFAPAAADRDTVHALMRLYETRPLMLGRLIYDRPPTVARSFADAFRIRPKRKE